MSDVREVTADDAPDWMDIDAANAWATGWNEGAKVLAWRNDRDRAVERVQAFLLARSKSGNLDPEVIYSFWADDVKHDLKVSDLQKILMAPDSETAS